MSKLENKKYTFWELLQKTSVRIPIIQRDYAQGRDNTQVQSIRENFLNNLLAVLENKKSPIDLDFVYGTVKNEIMVPLDGQQRLTTLFLLHYFLALKDGKLDGTNQKILQKFTYETRLSSREFISLLITKNIELNEELISTTIKNQTWFFSNWENDPTIKGMLVMLNSIQDKFKDTDKSLFGKLLSERKPITFSFLNLKEFRLTDELYIKMNARGKPLSEFENFKSKFEESIDDPKIKAKLDNNWFDIFWKIAKNEVKDNEVKDLDAAPKLADDMFFNFFKNLTAFYSEEFNKVDILKFNYSQSYLYDKKDLINVVKTILDCLIEDEQSTENLKDYQILKIKIFGDFINIESSKPEYEKRIRFYALKTFFIHIGKIESNKDLFEKWMRINLNISQNIIYNTIKEYKDNLELIDKMIKILKSHNFYEELKNSNISESKQFREEKLKAKLILDNSYWGKEFIEAEKNWYLDGQIGFLIKYSKDNFDKYIIGDFIKYRDKFIKLWNFSKMNKKNEYLIQRALLTFSKGENGLGYINITKHSRTNKYTFCVFDKDLRTKNENWRQVFEEIEFKQLLDEIKIIDNLEIKLKEIINGFEFNCYDWRSYIINPYKDWSILDETRNYQIQYIDKNNIVLNRGDTKPIGWGWSRVAELYSYYLYRYLKYDKEITPFKEIKYFVSIDKMYSLYFNDWQIGNSNYAIDIRYKSNEEKYSIEFFDRNNGKLNNIIQSLKAILENKNFNIVLHEQQERYINIDFQKCKQDELIDFLKELLLELND